jgi:hypothetical protein
LRNELSIGQLGHVRRLALVSPQITYAAQVQSRCRSP